MRVIGVVVDLSQHLVGSLKYTWRIAATLCVLCVKQLA